MNWPVIIIAILVLVVIFAVVDYCLCWTAEEDEAHDGKVLCDGGNKGA